MLKLLNTKSEKARANSLLRKLLISQLNYEGIKNLSTAAGPFTSKLFSSGNGGLWCAFTKAEDVAIPRFWNGFGIYEQTRNTHWPILEINISIGEDFKSIGGFFAKDIRNDNIYLMHSGKIGGGKPGVGKFEFLSWLSEKLQDADNNGEIWQGLIVSNLADPNIVHKILRFTKKVEKFKEIASDLVKNEDFRKTVDDYKKEFSGVKRGERNSDFEYVSYHGEIVDLLQQERLSKLTKDEVIFKNPLVDLGVKMGSLITEIYEVKTSLGRQTLYTAIGQLVTHAVSKKTKKILVIPQADDLPPDFNLVMKSLSIQVIPIL